MIQIINGFWTVSACKKCSSSTHRNILTYLLIKLWFCNRYTVFSSSTKKEAVDNQYRFLVQTFGGNELYRYIFLYHSFPDFTSIQFSQFQIWQTKERKIHTISWKARKLQYKYKICYTVDNLYGSSSKWTPETWVELYYSSE